MKFDLISPGIGKETIAKVEKIFTKVIVNLCRKHTVNDQPADGSFVNLGGDAFISTLLYAPKHVLTTEVPTAATDGKHYYWNPYFLLSMSFLGIRFIATHEALHTIYMHPARIGGRNDRLWNWVVDFAVHNWICDDLKARPQASDKKPEDWFKEVGGFITIPETVERIKNPFKTEEDINDIIDYFLKKHKHVSFYRNEDEMTEDEKVEMYKRRGRNSRFYFDPNIPDDLKKPEYLYDYFMEQLPRCPKCGKVGQYKMKEEDKKRIKEQMKKRGINPDEFPELKSNPNAQKPPQNGGKKPGNQPGGNQPGGNQPGGNQPGCCDDPSQQGNQPGQGGCDPGGQGGCCGDPGDGSGSSGGCACPGCGSGGDDTIDIFNLGGLVDEHMNNKETVEEVNKRIAQAIHNSIKSIGKAPAGMEDEFGELSEPKITWENYLISRRRKHQEGNTHKDWTRYKKRPIQYGLFIPKTKTYSMNWCILIDTSGSMGGQDIAHGISQLLSIKNKSTNIWTVCADAEVYWDNMQQIKSFDREELKKIKIVGRGGTDFVAKFYDSYKDHIKEKLDIIVIITDGFISENNEQLAAIAENDKTQVVWLITYNATNFHPPFGKVFYLYNENVR